MKVPLFISLLALAAPVIGADADSKGWVSLFDGKSLDGWKANDEPGTFSVANGEIVVHGKRSHLFYVGPVHGADWKNFELKAKVLTKPGSNSGIYFHTAYQDVGWPDKGFEVQVNNSHKDTKRTAGLYDVKDNFDHVADDDKWFTMDIRVEGKHVVVKVDDKVITDWTQPDDYTSPKGHKERIIDHGTFALQGHDPGSEVHFKDIEVMALP